MFIEGFSIAGYKSFGEIPQRIGPLRKINLFIGQNNSGKSNVLSFLVNCYSTIWELSRNIESKRTREWKLEDIDKHIGQSSPNFSVEFGLEVDGKLYKALLEQSLIKFQGNPSGKSYLEQLLKKILSSKSITRGTNMIWFPQNSHKKQVTLQDFVDEVYTEYVLDDSDWNRIHASLNSYSSNDVRISAYQTLEKLNPALIMEAPRIDFIPAIRKIDGTDFRDGDYSGLGLINHLAKFQNAGYKNQHLKESFEKINNFVREILDNETASLHIPYERDIVEVIMDGKTLPLSSLGTGIHEVIILAVAATVVQNQILCIEEPEIHLHPMLQRKLIRYLQEKTDNQYFITTHSAHLLDASGAAIFHIQHQDGRSLVNAAYTSSEKSLICSDLGYRASDLLQANSIVWVEGPSDRIYLNHWIHAVDPNLVEGLHYSIMFYGGRLLSHLSADDEEINDFISLRRLNRHISIIIDSDKQKKRSPINSTKQRIRDEFNKGPGFAWITKGREIENYVEIEILENAVKQTHRNAEKLMFSDSFEHALYFKTKDGKEQTNVDKVKVARQVVLHPANLDVLDLRQMMDKLIKFIHEANQ